MEEVGDKRTGGTANEGGHWHDGSVWRTLQTAPVAADKFREAPNSISFLEKWVSPKY
jgi:hypothetical protein